MQSLNMFLSALVALALLAHSASAQNNTTYIDPNSVNIITRSTWCPSQKNICTTLCNQCAQMNNCFPDTLTWNCTCCDTSITPDVAEYIGSVAYWICETSWEQCNRNNQDNQQGQATCKTNILDNCGNKNISDYVSPSSTTSTSTPTSTSTSTITTSTPATVASPSATKSNTASALSVGAEYGTAILAAGFMVAFGFLG